MNNCVLNAAVVKKKRETLLYTCACNNDINVQ